MKDCGKAETIRLLEKRVKEEIRLLNKLSSGKSVFCLIKNKWTGSRSVKGYDIHPIRSDFQRVRFKDK